ncbi:MAG: UDP-2,3-diacylglucosamine diphosphatase [Verrucomicrobiaceae bacterium]|nr:UDP-2,3-diacylglucosamine diphosphatase [Verrucomicrobiaceae bacterium]
MTTLFISDLHLQPSHPDLLRACLDWFETTARGADALYLLGDIFEAWIGDDDDAPWLDTFSAALRALNAGGIAIYFMHGNRDFLVGEQFAQRCAMQLLPESVVIDLYGHPTLLLHGDTLCTEDSAYLAFRAQVRNPQWQQMILSKSLPERRALAAMLREQSKMAGSNKAEDIMDVTPTEVARVLEINSVDRLIHGHTHRPARHGVAVRELSANGKTAERIVLGDWRENDCMWYVRAEPDQSIELIQQSI